MWKFFDSTADRFFALVFALMLMQAPAFFQQYLQRLSGGVDELKGIVATMDAAAKLHGKTLNLYISKFQSSSDVEISHQGKVMLGITERLSHLQEAQRALENAKPLSKPLQWIYHFDLATFKGTLSHFEPALELSIESLLWGITGIFFGLFLYLGVKRALLRLRLLW